MRALVLEEAGEAPRIAVREVPYPLPGPNEVVVRVTACGLCYHDAAVMRGLLRRGVKPQVVLGHEISGRVAEVGGSVGAVQVGEGVVSTLTTFCGQCERCASGREYRCVRGRGIGHALDGGFAQFVKLPESSVVRVPDGVELEGASIAACPMGVALQGLRDAARVRSGETVLVTGAGGGVGVHALRIASVLGARTLAVTTSPDKEERLRQLGASDVIPAGELDFSEVALALTEDRGVDVVIDTVGSTMFDSSLRSLAQFGRMVLIGEIAGGAAAVNPAEVLFRDAAIIGSTGAGRHHIRAVLEMMASGMIEPLISRRFPLEEAEEAYGLMRGRRSFGRVVLVP